MKNISNIRLLLEIVEKLSNEIEELDRFGAAIADGELVKLNFAIDGFKPKKKKVSLDEDGSLTVGGERRRSFFEMISESHNSPDISIRHEVDEKVILQMLGSILAYKIQERDGFLKELKELGIKI